MVRLLLNAGANVHVENDCPLRFASHGGHIDVVELLLEYGANARAENDCALYYANDNGHSELVTLLLTKMNQSRYEL